MFAVPLCVVITLATLAALPSPPRTPPRTPPRLTPALFPYISPLFLPDKKRATSCASTSPSLEKLKRKCREGEGESQVDELIMKRTRALEEDLEDGLEDLSTQDLWDIGPWNLY